MNPTVVNKLKVWRESPLLFATEALGVRPSDQQAHLLSTFPKHKRNSVRSGHGTGKDACASWIILWFMTTRPYAKVVCTAPTARQLGDILWSELSKWLRKSILSEEFVVQKDKLFHKDAPKEWWVRAVSPSVKASREEQAETLAGFHGDHLLIIVDEASGVPDPVYIPLEGAMTQEDNYVLLIGNPTKAQGYFHETQFSPTLGKNWNSLHWDSRLSTNVSKDMIQYFTDKYGVDSNVFRIRVAGDPPRDDENSFISLSDAIKCIGNELEVDPTWPLYLSVDVARYGEDASIILPRRGNLIMPWTTRNGVDTMTLARTCVEEYKQHNADGIGIDGIGIGGGVVDWLQVDPRGLGTDVVYEVNSYDASSDNKKWHRQRDELWSRVKDKVVGTKYSFPDVTVKVGSIDINIGHELANELSTPTYKFDASGAIQLESKIDMKKRGHKSPNIADALAISEYFDMDMAFALWGQAAKNRRMRKSKQRTRPRGKLNWMAA